MLRLIDGKIRNEDAPALSALNMRLRDDYVGDCNNGVGRWNKVISEIGIPFELKLPHVAFHRHIGEFSSIKADVNGEILSDADWQKRRNEFLPSDADRDFIEPDEAETEPGKIRRLDRAAEGRHRQQAGRLRIREDCCAHRHRSSPHSGLASPRQVPLPFVPAEAGTSGS